MTGYGRGECFAKDRRFKVEIKSVNHRFGDITIKLPRFLNALEERVRKRLAQDIIRGKADVYIHFESFTERDIRISVNTAFADSYTKALRELASRYIHTEGEGDAVTLSMLTAQPDIFTIDRDNASDSQTQAELWDTLSQALEGALNAFNAMREAEGAALLKDLLDRRDCMRSLLLKIKERAPQIASEYAAKLKERIAEMLADYPVDEGRLLTEAAIFADRSAVDEEIARLESHIIQMGDILDESANIGRKLDFLVQEMNREANTIGSKSGDIALTKLVVDIKSEIEKIREQVQNLE
jgi:uncharacterized protein (TIGR00255 family)